MGNKEDDLCKMSKMPLWGTYIVGGVVIAFTLVLTFMACKSESRDRFSVLIEPPYSTTLKDLCDSLCKESDTMRNNNALCDSIDKVLDAMSHANLCEDDSEVVVQVFRGSANGISFIKDGKGASQFTLPPAFFLFPLAVLVIWYAGFVYVKNRLRIYDRNEALRREICERQDTRENELPMESLIRQLKRRLCNEEAEQESDMKGLSCYLKKALQIYGKLEKKTDESKYNKKILLLCDELNKVDMSEWKNKVSELGSMLENDLDICNGKALKKNKELKDMIDDNKWEKVRELCDELKIIDVNKLKRKVRELGGILKKEKDGGECKINALCIYDDLKMVIDDKWEKVLELCDELKMLNDENKLIENALKLCDELNKLNDVNKLKSEAKNIKGTLSGLQDASELKQKVNTVCDELNTLKDVKDVKDRVCQICDELRTSNCVNKRKEKELKTQFYDYLRKKNAYDLYNTLKEWEKYNLGQDEEPC